MKYYSLFGHTADIGIRVRAKTLKSLFAYSAKAVFELSFCRIRRSAAKKRIITVRLRAKDIEELFVNWINELLSLSQARGVVFSSFKIRALSPSVIVAEVTAIRQEDFQPQKEIKAATYHGLEIKEKKNGWQAKVILDV